jgi:cysteinyl-tRNA synthetase
MLKIYNSLTQQKEEFKPIKPNHIGLYVCGLTVYDYCHLGHARIFIVFDSIVRYLRFRGFSVKYVRNITDIDDKIIKRAQENNEDYQTLTARFINYTQEDEKILGVLPPDVQPRATEHIPQIIAMIAALLNKGFAYLADNGDVYYDINKFKSYGELAQQDLESLRAGARVEVAQVKRDPLDFVLWKMTKPGEPNWDSPWGKGRPGWHIECSAMATYYLGNNFDIHGGGMDLQFPHHQNEIAQAEAALGTKFVNYWLHLGLVQVDQKKMSKSLGNFFVLRDALQKFQPEAIKYFMLASHYRSPLNYSEESLLSAKMALQRLYNSLRDISISAQNPKQNFIEEFNAAMDDDFNTPEAIAVLFKIAAELNLAREKKQPKEVEQLAATLKYLANILGLLESDPEDFLQADISPEQRQEIESLISLRTQARQAKNWQEADRLRQQLTNYNIDLEDTPQGTKWRVRLIGVN